MHLQNKILAYIKLTNKGYYNKKFNFDFLNKQNNELKTLNIVSSKEERKFLISKIKGAVE